MSDRPILPVPDAGNQDQPDAITQFCLALTALSRQFKLGVGGTPALFTWEDEDAVLHYICDDNGALAFMEA